jgi:hypothetical protein
MAARPIQRIADAVRYIKTLRDSGQLTPAEAPNTRATHQIERDQQGRQVLRRKRISSMANS